MTPKRNRTLNAGAGLVTALTLGVATLAGCAPFDPNPAQVPTTNAPPAANTGTTPGVTPVTPGVTPPTTAPIATESLTIEASVNGAPLLNADVSAIDLSTGKTLALVSAGGLNRRLSQVGGAANPFSNGNGNYSFKAPNGVKAFKIVIRDAVTKVGVSTIIGGNSNGLKGIGGGTTKNSFKANPSTTVAANALEGLFSMASGAGDASSQSLLDTCFSNAGTLATAADNLSPEQKTAICASLDASGSMTNGQLDSLLNSEAGFKSVMLTAASNALQSFAAANVTGNTADFSALAADLAILESLGFDIDLSGGALKITGNGIEVGIEEEDEVTPPETGGPIVVDEDAELDEDNDNDEDGVSPGNPETPDDEFTPAVTMTLNDNGSLELRVEQGDDEDGVAEIVARIPKDTTGADFLGGTTIATGSATGGVLAVNQGTANGTFTVVETGSEEIALSAEPSFGTEFGDITWFGEWKDAGTRVAYVNVAEDDDFITLVIQADMGNGGKNASAAQNGHITTMTVPASVLSLNEDLLQILEDDSNGTVDIFMSSAGNGYTATYRENIQVEAAAE